MLRVLILIFVGKLIGLDSVAQVKKQFSVEKNEPCKNVELCLKAKTGNCFIRPTQTH